VREIPQPQGTRLLLPKSSADWDEIITQFATGPTEERRIFAAVLEVVKTHRCDGILVEEQYVDRDYRAEFASIYSRIHRSPSRETTRLIFFRRGKKDKHTNGVGEDGRCLGYVVLRPLTIGRVGRSFLMPPAWPKEAHVVCRADNNSHVGHQRFTIDGSPFIHQDAMVMVCAQASIWTALYYLHVRYGTARYVPSDITERAYRNLSWHGAQVPTAGLTLDHMVNAVAQLGYAPIVQTFEEPTRRKTALSKAKRAGDILRMVMPYLESQIPVILVLPEHAVCAVGHVLANARLSRVETVQRLADWTAGLIVHDDAVGPYRVLMRSSEKTSGAELLPSAVVPFLSKHHLEDVVAVIVPMPAKLHSTADAIETHVDTLLKAQSGELVDLAEYARAEGLNGTHFIEWEHAWRRKDAHRLTVRTYLIDTVEYIRSLASHDFLGFNQDLRRYYSRRKWPRTVWVSELVTQTQMESSDGRQVIGEVISDPTANRYERPFLSVHVPGFVFDFDEHQLYTIKSDRPYAFGTGGVYSRVSRPF